MTLVQSSTGVLEYMKGQEVNDVIDTFACYWRLIRPTCTYMYKGKYTHA